MSDVSKVYVAGIGMITAIGELFTFCEKDIK